jgi:hypothetical protein
MSCARWGRRVFWGALQLELQTTGLWMRQLLSLVISTPTNVRLLPTPINTAHPVELHRLNLLCPIAKPNTRDCDTNKRHPSAVIRSIATMPGFDFTNYNRNAALHARGVPLPKATSTGTTIVGCIFDGGVVVRKDGIRVESPRANPGSRSPPTQERRPAPSLPTRTARSFTTSPPRSGVPVPERPPIPSSPRQSSRPTSSCTHSPPAASPASSPA